MTLCLVVSLFGDPHTFALAESPLKLKTIGDKSYMVRLLTEENFADLDNWVVEMESQGKVEVRDNILHWDARNSMGTMWNKTLVRGPSIIEYEVQHPEGKNNINAFFYGSILKNEQEILIETTHQRTGDYSEYHSFPNYIVTYLSHDPSSDIRTWRVRFRKDPGFNLLSEKYFSNRVRSHEWQLLTYVFDQQGSMGFYVNNQLVHADQEGKNEPYRIGYHALRTWKTSLKYKAFKIYLIIASSLPDSNTAPEPLSPN